jgi:dihydroorotate dehydrogenase (fumarate)
MDTTTTYLGLTLKSPIVVGSGPLDQTFDLAKECEAAGAGMLVMHSLFEEQFTAEQLANHWAMEHGSGPELGEHTEVDDADAYLLRPEEYFERLAALKQSLKIPLTGSINGVTPGNWVMYAREMQEAGADAIELNVYDPVVQGDKTSMEVEARLLQIVRLVRRAVHIPLSVKLSPFYTSFGYVARQLDKEGVDGITMFNRFYQPDIDVENMRVNRSLRLSVPEELNLRLRWTAALSGQVKASLAVSGGVHTGRDILKAVLAGAHVVQVVSAVMRNGPAQIGKMLTEMDKALTARGGGAVTLASLRGRLSLENAGDRDAYERANYVQLLRDRPGAPA